MWGQGQGIDYVIQAVSGNRAMDSKDMDSKVMGSKDMDSKAMGNRVDLGSLTSAVKEEALV